MKLQPGESCHECERYSPKSTLSYCTAAECEGPHFECHAFIAKQSPKSKKVDKEELLHKMRQTMRQALNEIKFCPPLPCPIADKYLASLTKIETMLNKI